MLQHVDNSIPSRLGGLWATGPMGRLLILTWLWKRGRSSHGTGCVSCSTPAEDTTHWNVGRKNLESWVWDFLNSIPPSKPNKPKTVAQSEKRKCYCIYELLGRVKDIWQQNIIPDKAFPISTSELHDLFTKSPVPPVQHLFWEIISTLNSNTASFQKS